MRSRQSIIIRLTGTHVHQFVLPAVRALQTGARVASGPLERAHLHGAHCAGRRTSIGCPLVVLFEALHKNARGRVEAEDKDACNVQRNILKEKRMTYIFQ